MQRLISLCPLASLRGNPIQDKQAWNHVGEDAIQGITDGVGVMIDGEKYLDAKGRNEYNQHGALPGNGIIQPAPLAKPGFFHAILLFIFRVVKDVLPLPYPGLMSLVKHSSAGRKRSRCFLVPTGSKIILADSFLLGRDKARSKLLEDLHHKRWNVGDMAHGEDLQGF